jgi:hypothetical protein
LSRAYNDINEQICRLRPIPEQPPSALEKKRHKQSSTRRRGK